MIGCFILHDYADLKVKSTWSNTTAYIIVGDEEDKLKVPLTFIPVEE
jgi:hypothetical protein